MNLRGRILAVVGGITAATALAVAAAPSALADVTVSSCTDGFGDSYCVFATTGTKDPSTGRQWVGWVDAVTYEASGIVKQEAWGDGFYYSTAIDPHTENPRTRWGAQKWVHSGTNVCTASTFQDGSRAIACIHITV